MAGAKVESWIQDRPTTFCHLGSLIRNHNEFILHKIPYSEIAHTITLYVKMFVVKEFS